MMELSKKIAIVTGASSGVGREVARLLAMEGVTVVVTARRVKRLEELAAEVKEKGGNAVVIPCDLRETKEITNLVQKTLEEFGGRIDILCNIAGTSSFDFIDKLTEKEVRDSFEVNVLGLMELTRQVSIVMKKQKEGHIVNMASYASRVVFPPMTVYAGTKYAVEGLTDGLRRELSPWNIKVTRVHPGGISGTEFKFEATHGGLNYKGPALRVTKDEVARRIVEVIKHPKRELLILRGYDFAVFINRVFPGIVDLVASIWIKKKAEEKGELGK